MKLKGLVFDCDGVVIENSQYHREVFAEMIRRYGGSVPFGEHLFARRNEDIFAELLPEQCKTIGWEALSEEKEQLYRDTYGPILKPVAGLVDLIAAARREGLGCAIGSSACRENVEFHMDVCGIRDSIDAYLCMEDVVVGKPDPYIYLECCRRLGLAPSECVVFEDATSGIEAGKRAGCKVVALATTSPADYLRQNTAADLVVKDFTELNLGILDSLLV